MSIYTKCHYCFESMRISDFAFEFGGVMIIYCAFPWNFKIFNVRRGPGLGNNITAHIFSENQILA